MTAAKKEEETPPEAPAENQPDEAPEETEESEESEESPELDQDEAAKLRHAAEQAVVDAQTAPVEEYPEDSKQFEEQYFVSEHFALTTHSDLNGSYAQLKPRNWVGEGGIRIGADHFAELKELLGKVKNLPK